MALPVQSTTDFESPVEESLRGSQTLKTREIVIIGLPMPCPLSPLSFSVALRHVYIWPVHVF